MVITISTTIFLNFCSHVENVLNFVQVILAVEYSPKLTNAILACVIIVKYIITNGMKYKCDKEKSVEIEKEGSKVKLFCIST